MRDQTDLKASGMVKVKVISVETVMIFELEKVEINCSR